MTTACVGLQESQIFCLPCSYVPPRIVRISLSVLGIGICMGGITIGAIGLSSIPTSSLSFWLNRTITLIGRNGCIGLIFGSYVLGTLLTEVGKDPIHSNKLAHKDNISKMQNTVEIATRIPRITLSIILDIALLIPYGLFLIYHRFKPDCLIKDEDLQPDKQLIVLIHGTNSNAGTWEFGKPFLQNGFRTFIEINLEENGSVMNQRSQGIDDYAQSVIGQLSTIQTRSGHRPKFVLIGHSMGGLVASYAAENLAQSRSIDIERVFTIATPWQGSPLMDALPDIIKPKRFHQMTENSEALAGLAQKVSLQRGKYCMFGSTTDAFVPGCYSFPEINKQNHRYPFLGHLAIVALPFVWLTIRDKLNSTHRESIA